MSDPPPFVPISDNKNSPPSSGSPPSSLIPSSGPNKNKSPAFVNALERARQIASKIKPDGIPPTAPGGIKRPIDDSTGEGPESKKLISAPSHVDPFFANKIMDGGAPHMDAGTPVGSMTETIMVPDKMVGLIIGRGGEQITRLQAESGCKIQMAQDSAGMSERSCTLTGNPQAIGQAKLAIDRIIANEGTNGGPGGPGVMSRGPMGGGGGSAGGSGFYEMNVPGQKVGLIIGKGGETIKQLQEQSGAKIVIIQEGPEAAIEKPLRITGAPENVEMAKQLVSDILNQDHERNNDMGGGGFGGRGRGRGRGGASRGGFPGRGGRGGGRGGFNGASQWGGHPGAPGGGSEYGGTHTDYISIPANKCGLVIGKGGETIKNINTTSGAHCEVDKNAPPDAREKNFVIRGPPEAVERAKQMIMEKIGLSSNGSSYGNSYGNGSAPGWGGGASSGQYQHSGYQDPNLAAQQPGAPDYSAQWAEYYRSMGMIREAEAIEKHMNGGARPAANGMSAPHQAVAPSAGPAQGNGAAPSGGGGADYSAQWAEYYRSVGKIKEAEAIENQIKSKAAGPPAAPGSQGYPPQYAAGYYGGNQPPQTTPGYPGAPAATGYPGYAGYPAGQES